MMDEYGKGWNAALEISIGFMEDKIRRAESGGFVTTESRILAQWSEHLNGLKMRESFDERGGGDSQRSE